MAFKANDDVVYAATNAEELLAKVPAKPTHVNRLKSNVSGLHLPSKEWQDEQVKNFTEVRLKLTRHIAFVQNAPEMDSATSSQEMEKTEERTLQALDDGPPPPDRSGDWMIPQMTIDKYFGM